MIIKIKKTNPYYVKQFTKKKPFKKDLITFQQMPLVKIDHNMHLHFKNKKQPTNFLRFSRNMKIYVFQKENKFINNFCQIQSNQIDAFKYFENFIDQFNPQADFFNYLAFLPFLKMLVHREDVFLCVFEGYFASSLNEYQEKQSFIKLQKVQLILANLFQFVNSNIMHKMLSDRVFSLLLQIIQLKQNIFRDFVPCQSYKNFREQILNVTKGLNFRVNFEFEQVMRLQYVMEHLLADFLPIKFMDIYIKYLRTKQKAFFRSILKNQNNIKFMMGKIQDKDNAMLSFLVQILFENIKNKTTSQEIVQQLDQSCFIKFISKLFCQINFMQLGNFITFDHRGERHMKEEVLGNLVLVIKYYFYFSSASTVQKFVESDPKSIYTNLQILFLLYIQDKNTIIRENCLDILLSILQKYLLVKQTSNKCKDIANQLRQVVDIFELRQHQKLFVFLECIAKLDQKNLFKEIYIQFFDIDFLTKQLRSSSKQKILHTIKIIDYQFQQEQCDKSLPREFTTQEKRIKKEKT